MLDRVRYDGDVYVGCLRASGCVIPAFSRYPEPRSYRRSGGEVGLGGIGYRIRSGMTVMCMLDFCAPLVPSYRP